MKLRRISKQKFFDKAQEFYYLDEKGRRQGRYEKWFLNGKQETIYNYKDGYLHGPQIRYYSNGKASEEFEMNDGLKHGVENVFSNRSKLWCKKFWRHGNSFGQQKLDASTLYPIKSIKFAL